MAGFGWDDLLSIPTGGLYTGLKQATGGATDISNLPGAIDGISQAGKNGFQATPYGPVTAPTNSVDPNQAFGHMNDNAGDIGASRGAQDWAIGGMEGQRGPQAWEDQDLSNREAATRGGDQAGALQLDREAAMGMAPSAAAYQMQYGLDQSLAQQQALAGGARGAGALAVAQTNMGNNAANLEQNAFTGAGQLRAQEMAQARGQYGDLSSGVRAQDQNRLQQGNQMAQFNAGLNDQYAMGMGQLGVSYGGLTNAQQGTNQGYFNTGVGIGGQNAQMQGATNELNSGNYNQAQALNAGVAQGNADESGRMRDRWLGMASTALQIPGGMGGTKPNPGQTS